MEHGEWRVCAHSRLHGSSACARSRGRTQTGERNERGRRRRVECERWLDSVLAFGQSVGELAPDERKQSTRCRPRRQHAPSVELEERYARVHGETLECGELAGAGQAQPVG